MRLLFFLVAATLVSAWYAWFIVRPKNPLQSRQILTVTGLVTLLLLAAFLRII